MGEKKRSWEEVDGSKGVFPSQRYRLVLFSLKQMVPRDWKRGPLRHRVGLGYKARLKMTASAVEVSAHLRINFERFDFSP